MSNVRYKMSDTQIRQPKFKKVKKPIKRTPESAGNVAVPAKVIAESPFNRPSSRESGFDVNDYLGQDNLPPMEQDSRLSPSFLSDDDIDGANLSLKNRFVVGNLYTKTAMIAGILASLILGIFIAKTFLVSPTTVQNGLQGVVINPDVPKGRTRCGASERTQGCVLYIMNPQRQELEGRDFYDWAAQLTNRQRFVIETANMRYAELPIGSSFLCYFCDCAEVAVTVDLNDSQLTAHFPNCFFSIN